MKRKSIEEESTGFNLYHTVFKKLSKAYKSTSNQSVVYVAWFGRFLSRKSIFNVEEFFFPSNSDPSLLNLFPCPWS